MTPALDPALATETLWNAPVGVILIDKGQRVAWLNHAAEQLLGARREDLLGLTQDGLQAPWRGAVFNPADTLHLEHDGDRPARWLQTWRARSGADGGYSVHYYADITDLQEALDERARLSEELAQHDTRDPLTGLPNRQALLQGIEPLVSRSRRYHNPLSVIRLRVNHLPELDASHGKGSGDIALVAITHMLKDQMRWADMIGRFDADEFLLVLPETAGDAARLLKDKLQSRLTQLEPKGSDGRPMILAAQSGVADWQQGDDRAKLLRRAREELEQGG